MTSGIVLIQGPQRYAVNGTGQTSDAFSLTNTPTQGNLLILTFAQYSSTGNIIDHITETNVTWTRQIYEWDSSGGLRSEIWVGVVGASPSKDITVTYDKAQTNHASRGDIFNIAEWAGLETSGFLDKTGVNNASAATGTTATTTVNTELCIGSICIYDYSQTNPTNGFTLFDGVKDGGRYFSGSHLYYIQSATDARSCAVTAAGSAYWSGCIATFKGKPYIAGVTRDANGAVLGGCTVYLFKTSDKSYIGTTTSDAITGVYILYVADVSSTAYFITALKDGSPNVMGITDDNLVGA